VPMREYFPATALLADAPVFDVAGAILSLLADRQDEKRLYGQDVVSAWSGEYGSNSDAILRVLSEAWSWLENNGFIATELSQGIGERSQFVTRAGRQVKSRTDFLAYAKESLLPRDLLRDDLAEIVRPLFLAGHFDQAVSAAFLQIEVCVRSSGGYPDSLVGRDLMRKAFHPDTGPLTFLDGEAGERQGVSDIFAGAMGAYRNPFSHRVIGVADALRAASMILLANELLQLVHNHVHAAKLERGELLAE
jgi:uncharacterized protein (TIGR02391 family)